MNKKVNLRMITTNADPDKVVGYYVGGKEYSIEVIENVLSARTILFTLFGEEYLLELPYNEFFAKYRFAEDKYVTTDRIMFVPRFS